MKGTNTGKPGRDDWRTPRPLIKLLNEWFGPFSFDAAADKDNCIPCADGYYAVEDDGLAQPWPALGVVWCNPPWGQAERWVNKAIQEHTEHGIRIVMLLPASTDTAWFKHLSESAYIILMKGRIAFELPDGDTNNQRPDRGAMVAVLDRRFPIGVTVWDWKEELV